MRVTKRIGPRRKLWTLAEYDRMVKAGLFREQRVELIEGEFIQMPPMHEPHAAGIEKTRRALEVVFGSTFWARVQMPLRFRPRSAPEPDVAVVPGGPGDYQTAPTAALLVVEVSDATLAYDRGRKASLYARFGIADYWIVNIRHRKLEIRRNPVPDATQRSGFRYADVQILLPTDHATPLAAPKARVAVADLLP
jgi:Uma2 family endonuclease